MNFKTLLKQINETLDFKLRNRTYVSDNYVLKMFSNSFSSLLSENEFCLKIKRQNLYVYFFNSLIANLVLSKTHINTSNDSVLTTKAIALKEIVLKGHSVHDDISEIINHAKNKQKYIKKDYSSTDVFCFLDLLASEKSLNPIELKELFNNFMEKRNEC